MRVIVGIATMSGREKNLQVTMESLSGQCDELHIYDNALESIDLADNGKFRFLDQYNEPIYYFSCDDDLIYPPDYVKKSISAVEKYGCIITYHGRYLLGSNRNYYTGHKVYRCLGHVENDHEIDVAGTGVTAFRTDYFNPTQLYQSEHKKMSDVIFSLEAAKQMKKIMLIGHDADWIVDQKNIHPSKTIHGTESRRCKTQGELCNTILDIKRQNSMY